MIRRFQKRVGKLLTVFALLACGFTLTARDSHAQKYTGTLRLAFSQGDSETPLPTNRKFTLTFKRSGGQLMAKTDDSVWFKVVKRVDWGEWAGQTGQMPRAKHCTDLVSLEAPIGKGDPGNATMKVSITYIRNCPLPKGDEPYYSYVADYSGTLKKK